MSLNQPKQNRPNDRLKLHLRQEAYQQQLPNNVKIISFVFTLYNSIPSISPINSYIEDIANSIIVDETARDWTKLPKNEPNQGSTNKRQRKRMIQIFLGSHLLKRKGFRKEQLEKRGLKWEILWSRAFLEICPLMDTELNRSERAFLLHPLGEIWGSSARIQPFLETEEEKGKETK